MYNIEYVSNGKDFFYRGTKVCGYTVSYPEIEGRNNINGFFGKLASRFTEYAEKKCAKIHGECAKLTFRERLNSVYKRVYLSCVADEIKKGVLRVRIKTDVASLELAWNVEHEYIIGNARQGNKKAKTLEKSESI